MIFRCANLGLLVTLLVHRDVPLAHSQAALARLLDTLGLVNTARLLEKEKRLTRTNADEARRSDLASVFSGRSVRLRGMSVSFDTFRRDSARSIVAEAKDRIDAGEPMGNVYQAMAKRYEYEPEPKKFPGYTATKVGNEGFSCICSRPTLFDAFKHFSSRGFSNPETLLTLSQGQTLILEESLLPSDAELKELGPDIFTWSDSGYVLFQAMEVIDAGNAP